MATPKFRVLSLLWSVVIFSGSVRCILTRLPNDVVTTQGSTITLPCYTNLSIPVMWELKRAETSIDDWMAVYQGDPGVIVQDFDPRFSVIVDSQHNQYNLTIGDIQPSDAGTYRCGDNKGLGLRTHVNGTPGYAAFADVIVTDHKLICEDNIKNQGHIGGSITSAERLPSDDIILTCNLSYIGNVPPSLNWFLVSEDMVNNSQSLESLQKYAEQTTKDNGANSTVTSVVRIPPERWLDKSRARCKVAGPQKNATDGKSLTVIMQDVSWLSEPIEVLYLSIREVSKAVASKPTFSPLVLESIHSEITSSQSCFLDTNVPCLMSLKNPSEAQEETRKLKNTSEGQAGVSTCGIVQSSCSSGSAGSIIVIVILCILLLVAIGLFLFCYYKGWIKLPCLRVRNRMNVQHHEELRLLESAPERSSEPVGASAVNSTNHSLCHVFLPDKAQIMIVSQSLPQMIEMPLEAVICATPDTLFAVGIGNNHQGLSALPIGGEDWSILSNLPSPRCGHCVAVVGNKLYVIGGWSVTSTDPLDTILCYDIASNIWTRKYELKFPIHSAACVAYGNSIYIFGGCGIEDTNNRRYKSDSARPANLARFIITPVNHVQVFDTISGSCFISNKPMPESHPLIRAALCDKKAFLVGRFASFVYDFEAESWEQRKRLGS